MNEQPDEMLPDEVDIEQWFPRPQPNPFPDSVYVPRDRIRSAWIEQEVNSIAPETSPPLQDVFHPFKIVIADSLVYVFPGYVYGNVDSKQFKRIIPTLDGSPLGNPLLGEGIPSIALSEQYLWIKITIANSTVHTAEIVYLSEASALDSDALRYIQIGKTFTNGTIEQRLKENAFVNIKAADWAEVTFNSITAATTGTVNISAGCVMRTETGTPSGTSPAPTKILTRLKDGGGNFLPELETGVAVANGDKVYMLLTYTQSTYGVDGTVFYDCTDAEYIVSTSASDSSTVSYIHIADIIIADSVMTIKPRFPGVVTAPTLVLPKDATAPENPCANFDWWVSDASGATADVIVNKGYVFHPSSITVNELGVMTFNAMKHTEVSATTLTEVENNDYVWLRITWNYAYGSEPSASGYNFRSEFVDVSDSPLDNYSTDSAAGPDDHSHNIALRAGGASNMAPYTYVGVISFSSADIIASATDYYASTPNPDKTYIKLATLGVSGLTVTPEQHCAGFPLTAYPIVVPWGKGVGD